MNNVKRLLSKHCYVKFSAEKVSSGKRRICIGYHCFDRTIRWFVGTVWEFLHALVAVGKSGQAGLAQVATPVGEALIMTGLGLAVAIPAVLAYNICVRFNRGLAHDFTRSGT